MPRNRPGDLQHGPSGPPGESRWRERVRLESDPPRTLEKNGSSVGARRLKPSRHTSDAGGGLGVGLGLVVEQADHPQVEGVPKGPPVLNLMDVVDLGLAGLGHVGSAKGDRAKPPVPLDDLGPQFLPAP